MKDLVLAFAIVMMIGSAFAQDWSAVLRRPREWRPPPPPHEPGAYRSRPPSPISYRGKSYASYDEFKASPDFVVYKEDNLRAAQRYNRYLLAKELRREAAVDFLRYRHQFRASTQVLMDESDRWHQLARTALSDLDEGEPAWPQAGLDLPIDWQ